MIVSTRAGIDVHVFYRSVFLFFYRRLLKVFRKAFILIVFFLSANVDCVFTECELANINNKDDRHLNRWHGI